MSMMIFLFVLNIEVLLDLYDEVAHSDVKRIRSWQALFTDFTLSEYLVGRNLGGNTGLFFAGQQKISGDGFVTGFTYDAGLLIVLLLIGVFVDKVLSIPCNLRIKISIVGSLILMLSINSGFEKLFIDLAYILSIGIIYGSFKFKSQSVVR